jgi:2,3-bisphosphoglycerate-dependent phosphoglycerate mutase
MRNIAFLVTAASVASFAGIANAQAPAALPAVSPTIVFLVRHAEKATDTKSDDPPLTLAGASRAEALGRLLEKSGVSAIYATELKRTQLTVAPLAQKLGQKILVVSSKDPKLLARRLASSHAGATVLVAGHSNTIPEVLKELGVKDPPPIADEAYGDLFIVAIANNTVSMTRMRYGEASAQ